MSGGGMGNTGSTWGGSGGNWGPTVYRPTADNLNAVDPYTAANRLGYSGYQPQKTYSVPIGTGGGTYIDALGATVPSTPDTSNILDQASTQTQPAQTQTAQPQTAQPQTAQGQFYQPIYRPQYQNYGLTNPFNVSQYGIPQQPTAPADTQRWFQQYATGYTPSEEGLNFWNQKIANEGAQAAFQQFLNPTWGGDATSRHAYQFNDPDWMMTQANPYQLASQMQFNPYQPQNPFSYTPSAQAAPQAPIVSRSSAVRGTPNVVRRAAGGIVGLLNK